MKNLNWLRPTHPTEHAKAEYIARHPADTDCSQMFVRYEFSRNGIDVMTTERPRKGQTQSGYGQRMPTEYKVRTIDQKWRRVYCVRWSNSGTTYIVQEGRNVIVEID